MVDSKKTSNKKVTGNKKGKFASVLGCNKKSEHRKGQGHRCALPQRNVIAVSEMNKG